MTVAACGHEIDLWLTSPHIICKHCFEQQGFVYNENSYRDVERGHRGSARNGAGTPLRGDDTPDRIAEMKRECAAILNPVLQLPGTPRHVKDRGRIEARNQAFAQIKARFGIGRATASQYALEFRLAP